MVDAVAVNEHVIPRTILGVTLSVSGLLAQPPLIGVITAVSGGHVANVLWSNGVAISGPDVTTTTTSPFLRVAAPGASALTNFAGQVVELTGGSVEYSGPVVQVLSVELDPVAHANVFTDCVVVRSRGPSQAYWVAPVSLVSVIS